MNIIVSAKNMELTQALKATVEKKLSKLEKYFNPNVEVQATLNVQKNRQIIEVTIPFNGVILRAEEENEDMYASIDLVVDKLERQIRKVKTRLARRQAGDALKFQYIPDLTGSEKEAEEPKIVKTKRFAMKPMSSEEAVLQMEMLGHNFFVYENADSGDVNVVYRRKDGNFGLIEPEF
ncbi:MAG: ribosome-associated translation inhibitor RaiA [Clostridiales bacterium]|uniref:ribosome hibernation-promoting factor, HPF/YfiA family n=1 Tax=Clostridium sp. N3C TaxID=1776758 RepID=UPI00092E009E|nr:ribosome-associated translation inhibitor RaiA [Clostridium sp. N3C]NLZ47245.1 ribosome-associated translation inhibitor RaiA [Clostridiales bacterium]SCN24981.1 SigL modulation protein [Clostridium sp. N3C]